MVAHHAGALHLLHHMGWRQDTSELLSWSHHNPIVLQSSSELESELSFSLSLLRLDVWDHNAIVPSETVKYFQVM